MVRAVLVPIVYGVGVRKAHLDSTLPASLTAKPRLLVIELWDAVCVLGIILKGIFAKHGLVWVPIGRVGGSYK